MTELAEINRRIVKNTMMLYFRMGITLLVQLYTSRIILGQLGVNDFGIYNVCAGVVVLFSFINGAMSLATQRFLSYEIGKGDSQGLSKVFSVSMTVHICIAILVLILCETFGLWFLNTHLVIPIARISAANWVYQFATFSACLGIIQIPYNSAIISHERMSFYASLAITEGSLDLLVAFSLRWFGVDKLVFYAILIFVVLIPIFVARKLYCNKLFPALKFRLVSDRMLFWEILGFSGWSLWGSVATMSATQGVNMLLNMFFGVTVNAAMGIASQVAGGLNGFVSNFQMAYRPQIVKSFAKCERGILLDMIFTSARMSVLLLFLFAAPVIMNMRFVLALWLKVVPTYAPIFCQVILACALLESLSAPMWMTIQATGRIRCYQLYISAALGLNIVLSYIFLRQGYPPATVLYIRLGIYALCLLIRLQFMRVLVDFPVFEFGTQVVARVVVVMGLSIIAPMLVCYHAAGWTRFCLSILVFGVGYAPAAFWLGLKEDERTLAMSALRTMAGSNSPPPLCS